MRWSILPALFAICALAQNTIYEPVDNSIPDLEVSIVGAGTDGSTTYIIFPTKSVTDAGLPLPTLTFIEDASHLVVPPFTVEEAIAGTLTATAVALQSCSLGPSGRSNCVNSIVVNQPGAPPRTTIFTSSQTFVGVTFAAAPTSSSSGSSSASQSQSGSNASQTSPTATSPSNSSSTPSSNPVATVPVSSNSGAASTTSAPVGFAAFLSALIAFLF